MQAKRVTFGTSPLPYLLLAPQLIITFGFFIWPAMVALTGSAFLEDAFGTSKQFVGLANFYSLFADEGYRQSFLVTIGFSLATAALSLGFGLLFAVAADKVVKGATVYRTILIWPYAIAPAIAAVLWWFLFNNSTGVAAHALRFLGINWNHALNGTHAFILVVIAAAWKQISYNFLFFLAGLQAIPKSLVEAAAIDGAGPWMRFSRIVWPLLAPTTFFLIVVNMVYAFFDTFGIVHAVTSGGPGTSTNILVYKVFKDGFEGLNLGSSAAQSVVLLVIVIALTAIQFRHIERKVHY
jgi:sn-glycerol 3-phosphate transport system permease protein